MNQLKPKRILAIGGGGFLMEYLASPIDQYVLKLTGKTRPRICYVGTASGDMPDGIDRFYAAYPSDRCHPSHLAFFRKPLANSIALASFAEQLLMQDAIYVGGGNTKSALGVWQEWGLSDVLRQAYLSGILLCGMSAGALCWFEAGLTDSFWGAGYQPLKCLGLLTGGCAVHYNSDPEKRARLHALVATGAMPASIAIDDFSAALYEDGCLARVLRWGSGSGAYLVSATAAAASEHACASETICCDLTASEPSPSYGSVPDRST